MVLVYAIVKAESFGWGSARTLGLAALGVALLAVFVFVEIAHRPARSCGSSIFKIRSLAVANFTLLLVAGGLFALFFFATLYVQEVLGFKPIKAGFAFLPVAFGIGVGAGTAQVLVKKIGVRANAILGMLIAAVGLFLLSRVPVDGTYLSDLFPGLRADVVRHGQHVRADHADRDDQRRAEHDAGLASGLFNTSQQVGGALGLAVLSTLAADKTVSYLQGLGHQPGPQDRAAGLVEGFQVAFTSAAILVTVGAILLALLLRSRDVANVNPEQGVTAVA